MEQHRTRPAQDGPRRGRPPLPPQADRAAGGGSTRPAPRTPGPAPGGSDSRRDTGRGHGSTSGAGSVGAADGGGAAPSAGPGPRPRPRPGKDAPSVPRPGPRPRTPRPGPPQRPATTARRLTLPAALLGGGFRFHGPRLTGLGGGLFCLAVMILLGILDQMLFGALTVYGVLFVPVCVLTAVWVRPSDLLTAPVVVPIAFALGLLPVAPRGDGVGDRLMGLLTALATEAGWLYGGTLVAGVIVLTRRIRLVRRRTAARNRATD